MLCCVIYIVLNSSVYRTGWQVYTATIVFRRHS